MAHVMTSPSYHGGWLAPNIFFLGFSGCVEVNGLRIAGSSGIFNSRDYSLGHFERLPFDSSQLRSIYHTRQYDVLKLSLLAPPHVFLSHDWPQGIEHHGDLNALLRCKSFFKSDIQKGQLGSPPMMELLRRLRPTWWFSAHLHVKYKALYEHRNESETGPSTAMTQDRDFNEANDRNPDEILIGSDTDEVDGLLSQNPDEIAIDDEFEESAKKDDRDGAAESQPRTLHQHHLIVAQTQFLALDKCLPRRQFLEVVDMPDLDQASTSEPQLCFNKRWLAISRALHPFLSTSKYATPPPSFDTARQLVEQELAWVEQNVKELDIRTMQTFWATAPNPLPEQGKGRKQQPPWYTNPQTEAFCQLLQIPNKVNAPPVAEPGNARPTEHV